MTKGGFLTAISELEQIAEKVKASKASAIETYDALGSKTAEEHIADMIALASYINDLRQRLEIWSRWEHQAWENS